MFATLRIYLVAMLLMSSVVSCIDHQFNPLSPSRMRLKTTNNINFGGFPFSTEYNYDASNRVTSFTTSIGSKGVYQYDEQGRYKLFDYYPKASDERYAEETYFVYNTSDNNFLANTGILRNGFFEGTRESFSYRLDADRRVLGFNGFPQGGVYTGESYFYTGGNITKVDYVAGRVITSITYEYDDKPNPYYGLIAPDIGATRRFSRNNVTKIIDRDGVVTGEYTYEYNAQGLPIKQKEKNGPGVVEYTYESY